MLSLTFVIVESAVTFLAFLNDLVTAEGAVALGEAIRLPLLRDGVQDGRNVGFGAMREFVVIVSVAGSRRREHDVITLQSAGSAFLRVIVRRPEIVSDFMRNNRG